MIRATALLNRPGQSGVGHVHPERGQDALVHPKRLSRTDPLGKIHALADFHPWGTERRSKHLDRDIRNLKRVATVKNAVIDEHANIVYEWDGAVDECVRSAEKPQVEG